MCVCVPETQYFCLSVCLSVCLSLQPPLSSRSKAMRVAVEVVVIVVEVVDGSRFALIQGQALAAIHSYSCIARI